VLAERDVVGREPVSDRDRSKTYGFDRRARRQHIANSVTIDRGQPDRVPLIRAPGADERDMPRIGRPGNLTNLRVSISNSNAALARKIGRHCHSDRSSPRVGKPIAVGRPGVEIALQCGDYHQCGLRGPCKLWRRLESEQGSSNYPRQLVPHRSDLREAFHRPERSVSHIFNANLFERMFLEELFVRVAEMQTLSSEPLEFPT
jgi:hypothetical protein